MAREPHYKRLLDQRTRDEKAAPSTIKAKASWLNPVIVVSLIGIVVAAVVTLLVANWVDVRRNLSDVAARMRQDALYSGEWTNDPTGYDSLPRYSAKTANDTIVFKIQSKDGVIGGEFASPKVCMVSPYPRLQVSGSNSFFGANVEVWDFVDNRVRTFGRFRIHVNRDIGTIELQNRDSPSPLFPNLIELGNGSDKPLQIDDPDDPDPAESAISSKMQHGFCPWLLKLARDAAAKSQQKPAPNPGTSK